MTRIYALPIDARGYSPTWTWGATRADAVRAAAVLLPDYVCVVLAAEPCPVVVELGDALVIRGAGIEVVPRCTDER